MKKLTILFSKSAVLKAAALASSLLCAEAFAVVNHHTVVVGSSIVSYVVITPSFTSETCTRYFTRPDTTTGSSVMPATVPVYLPPYPPLSTANETSTNQQSGVHSSYVVCPSGTSSTVTTVVP